MEDLCYKEDAYEDLDNKLAEAINRILKEELKRKVEKGRTYRMRIERRGSTISFWADNQLIARMDDPQPLQGRGHDHFAFNNWQSELWFDNLKIEAL